MAEQHLDDRDDPVARAAAELESVGDRELNEHPDAFARVHEQLQRALATVDDA